jgi:hypothetical protein
MIRSGSIVDLLVNQLKIAIRELLQRKGVHARVLDKVNARGQIVIGVILEGPPAESEEPGGLTREERRERRER